jgi:hypothetical protein
MAEIMSVDDHTRLLAEPKAVLCLWFDWSQPAKLAKAAVLHWHERWHVYCKTSPAPLYLLDGDKLPVLSNWMREALQETGGSGSLYLLVNGAVVERFPSVIDSGLGSISAACDRVFGAAGAPRSV